MPALARVVIACRRTVSLTPPAAEVAEPPRRQHHEGGTRQQLPEAVQRVHTGGERDRLADHRTRRREHLDRDLRRAVRQCLDGDRDIGDRFGREKGVGDGLGNASRLGPLTRTSMRSGVMLVLRNRKVMVLASPASVNVNGAGGWIESSIACNSRSIRSSRTVTAASSIPVDISVSRSARHCGGRGSSAGSIVAVFSMWRRTTSISWTRSVRSAPAVGGNVTRTGSSLITNVPVDPGTTRAAGSRRRDAHRRNPR